MSSFQISRSGLSPMLGFRSDFSRKSNLSSLESEFTASPEKTVIKLQKSHRRSEGSVGRSFKVCCRLKDGGENEKNGEEPPESLFMKELRRRGMNSNSLLEESKKGSYKLDEEVEVNEDDSGFSKRNVISTDYDKSLTNQRERSLALNSEGLEGLIPRAKLLLTLGGTFFLAFGPLILVTVAFSAALYIYFGPSFIHDGTRTSISPPPYIDPYTLLEDERISQGSPFLK